MTSSDIAKIVGVSRSTVSKVLNNYPNIPESTRKKVLDAVEKHGYKPNLAAQSLAGKKNKVIGIFLADITYKNIKNKDLLGTSSPYFLNFISEVAKEAKKNGYLILVDFITEKSSYSQMKPLFLNNTIAAGILIGFNHNIEEVNELLSSEFNVVAIDILDKTKIKNKDIYTVNTDDFEGAYTATKHLIDNGHQKILHISGGGNRLSSIKRREGFKQAMKDAELKINQNSIINGEYVEEVAYNNFMKLLEKEQDFTAIFCSNDVMALGVLKALEEKSIKVPENVSIVSYDDLAFSQFLTPPLTTMRAPTNELAKKATNLLFKRELDKKIRDKNILCNATLIERKSVKNLNK